jgi:hypothetical protein
MKSRNKAFEFSEFVKLFETLYEKKKNTLPFSYLAGEGAV